MPKRLEMILTSSGCDTSLGIRSSFGLVVGEDLVYFFVRQVVVEGVVDLHRGSPATGADALDFFEREETVSGDALVADAELFFQMLEDIIGAAQHAADV